MPVAQTRASNPARTGGSGHDRSTSRGVHSTGLVGHLNCIIAQARTASGAVRFMAAETAPRQVPHRADFGGPLKHSGDTAPPPSEFRRWHSGDTRFSVMAYYL